MSISATRQSVIISRAPINLAIIEICGHSYAFLLKYLVRSQTGYIFIVKIANISYINDSYVSYVISFLIIIITFLIDRGQMSGVSPDIKGAPENHLSL